MKTGLVLEGGAMRGMYTAGILDVFMAHRIGIDLIAGTSAGALFGVNFLSGQSGRVIRYNKRFNGDHRYMGLYPLIKEGNLVSTKYAYDDVPRRLDPFDDETYKKSPIPFYAVVTDLDDGNPRYIRIKSVFDQMDVLRASGSMPFVSKPVEIGLHRYLDGGISDSIPFEWVRSQGMNKIIVILTRDMTYRKSPMPSLLIKTYARRYPQIAKRLAVRHEQYNRAVETLAEWEQRGEAFVIRPSQPINISKTERDPDKLQSVYDLGLADGAGYLPALKEYLLDS